MNEETYKVIVGEMLKVSEAQKRIGLILEGERSADRWGFDRNVVSAERLNNELAVARQEIERLKCNKDDLAYVSNDKIKLLENKLAVAKQEIERLQKENDLIESLENELAVSRSELSTWRMRCLTRASKGLPFPLT